MKIIKGLTQGTKEWLAHREKYKNASEASIIMGCSPYKTRSQLMEEKKTGITPEVDSFTQARFDAGHATEAQARIITETRLGQDLYPIVAVEGNLGASFDGMTLDGKIIFEHKLWNEDKATDVRNKKLPKADFWQIIHQFYVSRAERCLYVVSDGTEENRVELEYTLAEAEKWFDELLAGWEQFEADLKEFDLPEAEKVHETTSAGVLPALRVEVQGKVLATNIDQFRDAAKSIITSINSELNEDADFAQAEADIKWCADVEKKLEAKEQAVMAQTADIETVIDTLREVKEDARQMRLRLDKQVKERKKAIKLEIAMTCRDDIDAHVIALQKALPDGYTLPPTPYSLNDAMKGKRTITSLRDAATTEAARLKADATVTFNRVAANAKTIESAEFPHLFSDKAQLALKESDDLFAIIKMRIAGEKQRLEAEKKAIEERARIEAEAKVRREAEEKARLEAQKLAAEERAKREAEEKQRREAEEKSRIEAAEEKPSHEAKEASQDIAPADIVACVSERFGISLYDARDLLINTSFEDVLSGE